MRYAQTRAKRKLHLVFEAGGKVSRPICGTHADSYRMTINVPLANACKLCLATYNRDGGARERKRFYEALAREES